VEEEAEEEGEDRRHAEEWLAFIPQTILHRSLPGNRSRSVSSHKEMDPNRYTNFSIDFLSGIPISLCPERTI
jgi:hypothetical protein